MTSPEELALTPDTVLVRADELTVRLRDDEEIRIETPDADLKAPVLALAILDAFARPRPMGEALGEIAGRGSEHFIEASSTILLLVRAGVLRVPGGPAPVAKAHGYVKPGIHIAMLDDHARTQKFCDAIRATVRAGDVVVDIGTGTGVLATCAAQAGASRVYAVESSGIADVAARVFEANGVADRIELVRERSSHASVRQRGNVLVTEMIGNDPLDELLLEIVDDARQRLLASGARIIPCRLELLAVPLDVTTAVVQKHVFTDARLEAYRQQYGIDFTPLAEHALPPTNATMFRTREITTWKPAAAPCVLADIDLQGAFETSFSSTASFALTRDVEHLGVALAFRATLAPGIVLSTVPGEVDPQNHWRFATWFGAPGLRRGTTVRVEYNYSRGTSALRIVS